MKLSRKGTPASVEGVVARPRRFKIEANALSFKIMSSGIYQDKVLACVRELSCNAADSHIAAGKKEVPFDVDLPTSMKPEFTVRDYGTGMNHRDIKNLYCGYFSSSRNLSNDFTGAMGLGSKSPFSYTEGFTVISKNIRQNKFRTVENGKALKLVVTYSMVMVPVKPEGVEPQCLRLHTRKMKKDEIEGLEVSFPIREQDQQEFENRAKIAFEFFNPRPNLNDKKFVIPTQEYLMKGDGWAMRKEAATHHTSKCRAIQGNVQYSVGSIDQSRMTPEQKVIADMPIDLFFSIGELSVTASRETLSNEEETIDAVLNKMTKVHSEVMVTAKSEVSKSKNEWDARLYLWNLENSNAGPIIKAALGRGDFHGDYGTFTIRKAKKFTLCETDFRVINLVQMWRNFGKWATKSKVFKKKSREERNKLILDPTTVKSDYTKEFDIDPKMEFFIADTKRGGEKFLHRYIQDASRDRDEVGTCYLFTKLDRKVTDADFRKEVDLALKKLGNPPLRSLASLEDKYPDSKEEKDPDAVQYERRKIVVLDTSESNAWSRGWRKATEEDLARPGKKLFVTLSRLKPFVYVNGTEKKQTWGSSRNMQDIAEYLHKAGLLKGYSDVIYGLKENSKLRLDSNWTEFTKESARAQLVSFESNPMIHACLAKGKDVYFSYRLEEVVKTGIKNGSFASNSPLVLFHEALRDILRVKNNSRLKALRHLFDYFSIKVKGNPPNVDALYKKALKSYPMLLVSDTTYSGGSVKVVIDYIRQCDAATSVPLTVAPMQEAAHA